MRKDIKKSSYYVWFLGAVEAKGFRGTEYVLPVIGSLVERERQIEPYKVTLHTSYKGVKIVRNLPPAEGASGKLKGATKQEVIKHFIPHEAITCVYQEEDIVACILLLYNPVTKCPLHVHVYRCDSVETARMLSSQLRVLVDRPDNQKKLSEMEAQLKGRTRDSESSGGSLSSGVSSQEKMASLYDSLAAELKEKLGTGPILLPPRDYDTMQRSSGARGDKEMERRTRLASRGGYSPGSSGIGSDLIDRHRHSSSDDDEWPMEQIKPSLHKAQNRREAAMISPRGIRNELDSNGPSSFIERGPLSRDQRDNVSTSAMGQISEPYHHHHNNQQQRQLVPTARYSASSISAPAPGAIPSNNNGTPMTASERFQDAKQKFLSLERREQKHLMRPEKRCDSPGDERPLQAVFRPQPDRGPPAPPVTIPPYAFGDHFSHYHHERRYDPRSGGDPVPPYREEVVNSPSDEDYRRARPTSYEYPYRAEWAEGDPYTGRREETSYDKSMLIEKVIPLERYRSPAPNTRYSGWVEELYQPPRDSPSNPHAHQYKRRSLYESLQEERKRNSNQLAKEFMKRSFQSERTISADDLNDCEVDMLGHEPKFIDRNDPSCPPAPPPSLTRVGIAPIHPY